MTLVEAVPRLQADLARALARYYPGVRPPARWLTFASWIGGDRDGNPNVTASVTEETLLLHRRLAIEKLRLSARDLARTLTVSDRRGLGRPGPPKGGQAEPQALRAPEGAEPRYRMSPTGCSSGSFGNGSARP